MSLYNIPVKSGTDANSLSIALSGEFFLLTFKFNRNEQKWYMDIENEAGTVVLGIKLVAVDDMLEQYRAYDVPAGVMSVVDKDGLYADPNETNFGESVFLRYED